MAGRKRRKRSVIIHLDLAARGARTALSRHLASLDLHPGQDTVLLAISEEDGIPLRQLAERLSVRPPTITKTVTHLVSQGLVEKRLSRNDGRQSHAHLTEKGWALVDAVTATRKMVERSALLGVSDKERKVLRKLLRRVTLNLAAAGAAPTRDADADD